MKLGITSVSSPFDKKSFEAGVAILRMLGFEVFYSEKIFEEKGYLAGSDNQRAEGLMNLFEDPSVDAICFPRGGYGAARILPHLNLKLLKKNPKPVIGFSDITSLLHFLQKETRSPVLYGPVVVQLGNNPSQRTLDTLKQHLLGTDPLPAIDLSSCTILKKGKVTAPIQGGCLSLLSTLMGTRGEACFDNAILFFEDVHEKVYAIDRMITQLKLSGKLKKVRGILIGTLTPQKEEPHSMTEMLADLFSDFDGPVVADFPSGHTHDFVSLPLGRKVTIDTTIQRFIFEETFLK